MKFYPLTASQSEAHQLESEYKVARQVGKLRLGELHLYFKSGLRTYYIPYRDVRRLFRRVESVPAKLCCGNGEFQIENLVVCGDGDVELAQIQLPGTKAAKLLMEDLEQRVPDAEFGRPAQN